MSEVVFRFYAELNDFLPRERRQVEFWLPYTPRVTVKHLIESLGVPHTEVDLILVNGEPAGFDYQVENGDRVSVYPVFETFNIASLSRLHPQPLRNPCFVLDAHLGRLAAYLRMLGFDTLYRNDFSDESLATISVNEGRILLTRDRGLLKRKEISRGYCVRSTEPLEQAGEILHRFDLSGNLHPFSRCMRCNGLLRNAPKTEVALFLQLRTSQYFDEFYRCESCGQVYWKGSHYLRMLKIIHELKNALDDDLVSSI